MPISRKKLLERTRPSIKSTPSLVPMSGGGLSEDNHKKNPIENWLPTESIIQIQLLQDILAELKKLNKKG